MDSVAEKYILSFLTNDDFIAYVVHPTQKLAGQWSDFFKTNPSLSVYAQEARSIIAGEINTSQNLNDKELFELKKRIVENCSLTISN